MREGVCLILGRLGTWHSSFGKPVARVCDGEVRLLIGKSRTGKEQGVCRKCSEKRAGSPQGDKTGIRDRREMNNRKRLQGKEPKRKDFGEGDVSVELVFPII